MLHRDKPALGIRPGAAVAAPPPAVRARGRNGLGWRHVQAASRAMHDVSDAPRSRTRWRACRSCDPMRRQARRPLAIASASCQRRAQGARRSRAAH